MTGPLTVGVLPFLRNAGYSFGAVTVVGRTAVDGPSGFVVGADGWSVGSDILG